MNREQIDRVRLAAVPGAILPMAALAVWLNVLRNGVPGLSEFFLGPLLGGGAMIFWLLYLHLRMCRESPATLGIRRDRLARDVGIGALAGIALLALKEIEQPLLGILFEPRPPSAAILTLISGVIADPWLLALWLGPVVWIGVAAFEELWRVFVLKHLWDMFPGATAGWIVLLLVSTAIGLVHGYQGPAAVVSIGVKSVLMGWYFWRVRRFWPLVVCHAVYDSVQIVVAAIVLQPG